MKNLVIYSSVAFLSIAGFGELYAQDNFTLGAQYKPRFELRNGFKRPILEDQDPAYFVEQRARLWADYKSEKFAIHINVQDVRMWGATDQIYKSDGTQNGSLTNVYEAYGIYNFSKKFSGKIGRQELDYDNARFLGNLDWAMQGRSHDALLFRYKTKDLDVHIGGALNQLQKEPTYLTAAAYDVNNYKNMQFLWLHKDWDKFNASFLFHNDGRELVNDDGQFTGVEYHRQTVGLIPKYSVKKFAMDGEFYYQMGSSPTGRDVSAYFLALHATLKTKFAPITLGAEYASGTEYDEAENDNSWAPLYGTNHKFYGYMDYFYVGNAHSQFGNNAGLIDFHLKSKLTFKEKNNLMVAIHHFMSPVDVIDRTNNEALDASLGTEVDLTYSRKLTKGVSAFAGYSHMFATESLEELKLNDAELIAGSSDFQGWFWLGMNFSAELFNKSKK